MKRWEIFDVVTGVPHFTLPSKTPKWVVKLCVWAYEVWLKETIDPKWFVAIDYAREGEGW